MRVISGNLKGKLLKGFDIDGTRPTMDKIKESLFAMIQNNIKDAVCLDLFAGSGSLGIEAISNGASYVYFVDNNKEALKTIKANILNCKINNKCELIGGHYHKALTNFVKNNLKFDLIFLDPPYQEDIIKDILNYINKFNLLNDKGLVICEFTIDNLIESYGTLKLINHKIYRDKKIKIYQNILP
ncbi:MAG: 16S rRNA (guanine(966)-N(2))-methyltransferase RsmD [Bacilli bacterium]|nr:16S rRNA (guanine(966)-N(2))-methyltransferase RsmD [Bacilli bacterium]